MNPNDLWPFATHAPSRLPPAALAALAGVALAACQASPSTRLDTTAGSAPLAGEVFLFESGGGTRARVTRAVAADGAEALHGETEIALGARSHRCIIEDVLLDARGVLVRADVTVAPSCGAEPTSRAHLDPSAGLSGMVTRASDPQPLPWIYAPEIVPDHPVTTPVAAWVAHRAAGLSPALTLVQPGRHRAWRVPSDQVEVPTELGTTVVLGDNGADVGACFVDRIALGDLGATLVRVPRGDEPRI